RRFTLRGQAGGVIFVDDYGHHPAEIRATLEGAKAAFPERRIVACFQPHRYTRTHLLWEELATCFNDADRLVVTDIFAAGEESMEGVDGPGLAAAIRAHGHRDARHLPRKDLAPALAECVGEGDLVITLGAGDIGQVSTELLSLLG